VSTVSSQYAYSYVVGERWSGALLRRPSFRSTAWMIVATQGSGINSCSYWLHHAPPQVVFDLELMGANTSGYSERCAQPATNIGGQ
jgi:hypothetical protein